MAEEKPNYAQINRKVWNTSCFRSLSKEARDLFFYLTTCPHGNMIGLFVLRPGYALDDLQLGSDRELFNKPLRELSDKHLFKYDPKTEIILDLEQLEKHQPENPNQVKAAIKIINSLPTTVLFQDLKQIAERLDKPFLKPLIELLDKRLRKPVTETGTVPVTETAGVEKTAAPVDNSPSEEKPTDEKTAFLKELKTAIDGTLTRHNSVQEQLEITNWITQHLRTGNPQAIIHCINQLLKAPEKVKKITSYLDAAFKIENGKYNAADSEKRCNEYKTQGIPEAVATFLNGLVKPMPAAAH